MYTLKQRIELLSKKGKTFIDTKIELYRLKSTLLAANLAGESASFIIILVMNLFCLILASIGFALWLGTMLGKFYDGFFIVSALYIAAGTVCFLLRKKLIKIPVCNYLLKEILKAFNSLPS